MPGFLDEFKQLSSGRLSWLSEGPDIAGPPVGGQTDLTPLRNKAREAIDALAEVQRAADQGKTDDCMEALRRAKAIIDIALGGQVGPGLTPPGNTSLTSP